MFTFKQLLGEVENFSWQLKEDEARGQLSKLVEIENEQSELIE